MSLFKKLFGGGGSGPEVEPVLHKDFRITVNPEKTGGGYRIGALIEKEVGGETQTHQMIRADMVESAETAADISLRKAKQLIDEQGEGLFG